LDYIKLGLFKIKEKKELVIFILDLLRNMRIYLTFYILLLKLALKNAKLQISLQLNKDDEKEIYNFDKILDC